MMPRILMTGTMATASSTRARLAGAIALIELEGWDRSKGLMRVVETWPTRRSGRCMWTTAASPSRKAGKAEE